MSATRSMAIRNARKNSTYFVTAGLAFSTRSSAAWRARKSRLALIVATRFAFWLVSAARQTGLFLGSGALRLRRGAARPARVSLVVRAAAELVGLRAARKTGLAVGKEAAVCDLPLEARLLGLRRRDPLLGRSDLRVVRASDLVRRLVDPRCR